MSNHNQLSNLAFLVTGGAGFIGSNLVEYLLQNGAKKVVVLDNLSTGYLKNIEAYLSNVNFEFIEGDIRDEETCDRACKNIDVVFHEAALGSVPRSIEDPITSNEVNISGFVKVLCAAKNNNVKRIVYAASSSTYGDSQTLPKFEDDIGKPLSPYAITKYVNELYADIFARLYNMEIIGLRYFNVFGRRQDPDGAYAAVIPKFVQQFLAHESPVINGDGSFSRDFTYIENVVQMNMLAALTTNKMALNQVYNTAYGDRVDLNQMTALLREYLSEFDSDIKDIQIKHGPEREGDIAHSLASIDKAKKLLDYQPKFNFKKGLKKAVNWYWDNLKK
ncbi:MAG: UDP-N-acetylglucosamine 4-epimerase [Flavobacteriales bacterium]|jgi:UDP-N-acetylglucosamine 4-epimerase